MSALMFASVLLLFVITFNNQVICICSCIIWSTLFSVSLSSPLFILSTFIATFDLMFTLLRFFISYDFRFIFSYQNDISFVSIMLWSTSLTTLYMSPFSFILRSLLDSVLTVKSLSLLLTLSLLLSLLLLSLSTSSSLFLWLFDWSFL